MCDVLSEYRHTVNEKQIKEKQEMSTFNQLNMLSITRELMSGAKSVLIKTRQLRPNAYSGQTKAIFAIV